MDIILAYKSNMHLDSDTQQEISDTVLNLIRDVCNKNKFIFEKRAVSGKDRHAPYRNTLNYKTYVKLESDDTLYSINYG